MFQPPRFKTGGGNSVLLEKITFFRWSFEARKWAYKKCYSLIGFQK